MLEMLDEYSKGKVLTIHTKNNGEISESGKGAEELEFLRKQAREVDNLDNNDLPF